jgi:hypothetical protein
VRERAAEVRMPATEYSRHNFANLCHISPLVRIGLVCLTRSHPPKWATKRHKSHKQAPSRCILMSFLCLMCLFVALVLAYTYDSRGRLND